MDGCFSKSFVIFCVSASQSFAVAAMCLLFVQLCQRLHSWRSSRRLRLAGGRAGSRESTLSPSAKHAWRVRRARRMAQAASSKLSQRCCSGRNRPTPTRWRWHCNASRRLRATIRPPTSITTMRSPSAQQAWYVRGETRLAPLALRGFLVCTVITSHIQFSPAGAAHRRTPRVATRASAHARSRGHGCA